MATEKRFKVHSMIKGMEIGETIDLELCEELIKKYGSSSDIDLLIQDNGNDMTYQEVVDLLNENEQLKQQIGNLEHTRDFCAECCERLEKENEELKQYNTKLINKIDFLERVIDGDV